MPLHRYTGNPRRNASAIAAGLVCYEGTEGTVKRQDQGHQRERTDHRHDHLIEALQLALRSRATTATINTRPKGLS